MSEQIELTEDQKKILEQNLEKRDRAANALAKINQILADSDCEFDVEMSFSTRDNFPTATVKVRAR